MKKPCRYDVMLPLAALAVIMTGVAWLLPHDSFWITDGGNKFILLQNLLRHSTTVIAYPAADIDPEGQFFPDGGFHFQRVGGHFQSFYPPYYPWLCAVAANFFFSQWSLGFFSENALDKYNYLEYNIIKFGIDDKLGFL